MTKQQGYRIREALREGTLSSAALAKLEQSYEVLGESAMKCAKCGARPKGKKGAQLTGLGHVICGKCWDQLGRRCPRSTCGALLEFSSDVPMKLYRSLMRHLRASIRSRASQAMSLEHQGHNCHRHGPVEDTCSPSSTPGYLRASIRVPSSFAKEYKAIYISEDEKDDSDESEELMSDGYDMNAIRNENYGDDGDSFVAEDEEPVRSWAVLSSDDESVTDVENNYAKYEPSPKEVADEIEELTTKPWGWMDRL